MSLFDSVYKPDVLTCLSDLSNDEVMTPPDIANRMLDLLPKEIWHNPSIKMLDPACKSGVFLREAAKRFIEGEKDIYPDLQERCDHIFKEQLYGIAITELTSLLSRRSLYCSKYPNGPFSIVHFNDVEGNVHYSITKHTWDSTGKCIFCGVSKEQFGDAERKGLETHAYQFIHTTKPEAIFSMHFDVIISNPPYQLSTAGDDNGAQAKPIYQKFVEQAIKLQPRYIAMITPSRWFTGGWGLDDFRNKMITENHLREIHDYPNSQDCFSGVDIKGGVSYFLYDKNYNGKCAFYTHTDDTETVTERYLKEHGSDILIRYNDALPILHKVQALHEPTFDTLVSTKKPFGFITNYKGGSRTPSEENNIKLYANKKIMYVSLRDVTRRADDINKPKVIVPKAVGSGDPKTDVIKPLYCEPGAGCTETYLLVGPFENEQQAKNVIAYIGTRFFHFLVTLQKNTQDCMKKVYSFVPVQDFNKLWTDDELYRKYQLTDKEITYIKNLVWPGKNGGDNNA